MDKRILKITTGSFLVFLLGIFGFIWPASPVRAQVQAGPAYEASARVPVTGSNFVAARKRAVKEAQTAALTEALKNLMGEDEFLASEKKLSGVLRRPAKYIKSYKFVEAIDDRVEMVSEVILSVTLYPEAIGIILSKIGVDSGPVNEKNVLVLIREKSISHTGEDSFWEFVPISETALVKDFIEAGVQVVGREPVRDIVREETVQEAIKGDMASTVNIGLQAGADLIILGNATSSLLEKDLSGSETAIQTSISVRVTAVRKSTVIAAKSDFATARNADPLKAELQAFDQVSRKLVDFLQPTLHRYWEKGAVAQQSPPPVRSSPPPLSINDL